MATHKVYLFLQGPHGSFMGNLAARLMQRGHTVCRINFNGGDWIDWPHAGADNYRGSLKNWPAYLEAYVARHGVTDIVFYGYWRPAHKAAMDLSRAKGLTVHGFEEGLLRPHWVTLSSLLPCEQAAALKKNLVGNAKKHDDTPQEAVPIVTGDNHAWMLLNCYRYYTAYFLSAPFFWRHRSHRGCTPFVDMLKWVWHFFIYPWRKYESQASVIRILRSRVPFFLLCLQLDGDSQIKKYSGFDGMADVMEQVIQSFALYAPSGSRLVVKRHPLDNHGFQHERTCKALARRYGVEEDVVFIPYGKLVPLLKRTLGVITVNSSSGFSALHHNCPLKTLGQAAYDIDGLVSKETLDEFWQNPRRPDAALYQALQVELRRTTQHPGGFYAADAQDITISSCLKIIEEGGQEETLPVSTAAAA